MNRWPLIPCAFVLAAGALACSGGAPSESATSTSAALSLQLDPCFVQAPNQTLAPGSSQSYEASGYEDTTCGWYTVDVTSVPSVQVAATGVPGDFIELKVVNYIPPTSGSDCSNLPPPCHPVIIPASETVLGSTAGLIYLDGVALSSVPLDSQAESAGLGGHTRLLARAVQTQLDGGTVPPPLTDFPLVVTPSN